jgi:hypothetical protein
LCGRKIALLFATALANAAKFSHIPQVCSFLCGTCHFYLCDFQHSACFQSEDITGSQSPYESTAISSPVAGGGRKSISLSSGTTVNSNGIFSDCYKQK